VQVHRFSKIRDGGVAIEVENEDQVQALQGKLQDLDLETRKPKKRFPKDLIYDVPRDYEVEELVAAVHESNLSKGDHDQDFESFKQSFKPLFRTGPRVDKSGKNLPTTNWVIEVSGFLFRKFTRATRLCLDWLSLKVVEFNQVTRCYKCQSYGHLAKACAAEHDTCGHCAKEGHKHTTCKDKSKNPTCVNCLRARKRADHSPNSHKCPVYMAELERQRRDTDYE